MQTVEDVLQHFGVKGMRWGVRRKTGSVDKSPSDDAASASRAKMKIRKGGIETLSNKELQSLVTRMNLEQQFSRMSQDQISKGANTVRNLLSTAKTLQEAYSFAKKTGALTFISKAFN